MENIEHGIFEEIFTLFCCRLINIGSYEYVSEERVVIDKSGIIIPVPLLNYDASLSKIHIKLQDIRQVCVHVDKTMPFMFIYLHISAGETIRDVLGMYDPEGPYFDPCSHNGLHEKIILRPNKLTEESRIVMQQLFKPIGLLEEITPNDLDIEPFYPPTIINFKDPRLPGCSTDNYMELPPIEMEQPSFERIDDPKKAIVRTQINRSVAKMLIIFSDGRQCIDFDIPYDECTLQDLLEHIGINPSANTTIELARNHCYDINYIVRTNTEGAVHTPDESYSDDSYADEEIDLESSLCSVADNAILWRCWACKIGSYEYISSKPVMINIMGIHLLVPLPNDQTTYFEINLGLQDINEVLIYFGPELSVLFCVTKPEVTKSIRRILGMEDPEGNYFYDPNGGESVKRIVVCPKTASEDMKTVIHNVFAPRNLLRIMTLKEAQIIMCKSIIDDQSKKRKLEKDDSSPSKRNKEG